MKPRSWTRRDFLTSAGISAAVLSTGVSPLSGADTPAANQQPLAIGFLGATHTHAMEKVSVIRASPSYRLIGVCEESAGARPAIERQGLKLLSRDELLERSAIIVIESAVRDHARDALLALRAASCILLMPM